MTAKELRRLRRRDLLEMLLTLRRENDRLRKQLEQAQKELADRTVAIENSGSLAEAALQLNGIFEAAQAACELYTENVRQRMAQQERETAEKCEQMLQQGKQHAAEMGWLTEMMDAQAKQGDSE